MLCVLSQIPSVHKELNEISEPASDSRGPNTPTRGREESVKQTSGAAKKQDSLLNNPLINQTLLRINSLSGP